jgi:hypothetical protein
MSGGYRTKDGKHSIFSQPRTKFLGTYSGRLPSGENSEGNMVSPEIGIVWRPKILKTIAEAAN